jgi:hypothetical protein
MIWPGADGVSDLGKVANIGDEILIKHNEVSLKSFLDTPLVRGFEVQSRICGE